LTTRRGHYAEHRWQHAAQLAEFRDMVGKRWDAAAYMSLGEISWF